MDDQVNFRRHRSACPFYREHWLNSGEVADPALRAEILYEAYCLKDTPPRTLEEQHRCMRSRHRCWRRLAQYRPRTTSAPANASSAASG